jgi:TRAP transporter 4TM/12TM fusion protein
MSKDEKKMKDIDVADLDAELKASKLVEENKNSLFIKIASIVAIAMCMFHIGTGYLGLMNFVSQRGFHLAFAMTILFLAMPLHDNFFKKKFAGNRAFRISSRIFDIACIVGVWVAVFLARHEVSLVSARLGNVTYLATIAGVILMVTVMEGTRRCLGWIMPILACAFIVYALIGPYLPLAIAHRGYSVTRILNFLATDLDGFFGTVMGVSSTVVFVFIMFGAFLDNSGCSNFFNDLALSVTGKVRSGPALSSVVGSALMGTINGSAIANVMATGVFTIPLMKGRGYTSNFAAAVEASASTAGQILPPVMGAGAFLMVAFTNTPYIVIVICATVPAILYFIGVWASIVAQTEIIDIKAVDAAQIPKTKEVLKSGWIYITIMATIITCLLIIQYTPMRAALYTTTMIPIIMLFDKKKRFTFKQILPSMIKAGFNSLVVVMGCAVAGVVVAMVSLTGIGVVFGDIMIRAAGGNMFISLIFTAVACIILGLGLPTTSAYVISASILAPSLAMLGMNILVAHLFVFYYANLSAITPPVALAAYAASGIAKGNPMKTALEACKLAVVAFIIPFAFVYSEALLLRGSLFGIITVCITAAIGTIIISMGFQGWLLYRLNIVERIIFMAAGILMFVPGTTTGIAGIAVTAGLILINMKKWKRPPALTS